MKLESLQWSERGHLIVLIDVCVCLMLFSVSEAQTALKRQVPNISSESEAQSLIFSLLALVWALRFHSSLTSDLEADVRGGLHRLADFLERCGTSPPTYVSQSLGSVASSEFPDQPRILMQSAGMLVALKPPGWEVDTSASESEALSLSAFLQSQLVEKDLNFARALHFIHYQTWSNGIHFFDRTNFVVLVKMASKKRQGPIGSNRDNGLN